MMKKDQEISNSTEDKRNIGKRTQNSKRNALTTMVAAGAVVATPQVWKTPVVNSIIIPAHASTTDVVEVPVVSSAGAAAAASVSSVQESDSGSLITRLSDRIFRKVVPDAHAFLRFDYEGFLCVEPTNDEGTVANIVVTVLQTIDIPAGLETGEEEEDGETGSGEAALLGPCVTTFEYVANNVPVGGGNVPLVFSSDGCGGITSTFDRVLDSTGLLPQAHAIGSGELRCDTLDMAGSSGSFNVPLIDGAAFTFNIPPGGCAPIAPDCCGHSKL